MNTRSIHDFGIVDAKGDAFEFGVSTRNGESCRLVAVVQTERGPRRTEVAVVPAGLWRELTAAAVKEIVSEMGEGERAKRAPTLLPGLNRLSPLVGRELGVLLLALMEEGAAERADALMHAWRELAREERWWLYAKVAAPGQRQGVGWRRALFFALSETSDTRAAPSAGAQKKSSENIAKRSSKKPASKAVSPDRDRPAVVPIAPRQTKAARADASPKRARGLKTTAR